MSHYHVYDQIEYATLSCHIFFLLCFYASLKYMFGVFLYHVESLIKLCAHGFKDGPANAITKKKKTTARKNNGLPNNIGLPTL